MGKSVMKSRMIKSRGFSLLEIIIALAIVGIVLVSLATYARKVIDQHVRQVDAEAVAQEVYGVLQFVNADTIEIFGSTNPGDTTKRVTKKVINPLYQLPGMSVYPDAVAESLDVNLKGMEGNPVWLAHPVNSDSLLADKVVVSPYIARNFSKNIAAPVSNNHVITDGTKEIYSHSLKWSQAVWGRDSVRNYFTDSGCPGNTGPGDAVYFKQQFLSCNENPALKNSEIAVSRIDLVNGTGSLTRISTSYDLPAPVNRVDVYVSFKPVDGNSARLEQFITPLITAFRAKNIVPNVNNVYLVMQNGSNSWVLLNKNGMTAGYNTDASDLAVFTDLPNMVGKLQKGRYALRFTFDGSGDYLRTDGLNAATKLCWNTTAGAAGPCLTSPSEELLVLNQRKDAQKKANLQVGSVISEVSYEYRDAAGNLKTDVDEYYTAPRVQYRTFGQEGSIGPYYKGDAPDTLCDNAGKCKVVVLNHDIAKDSNGAVSLKVQICPVMDGFDRKDGTDADSSDYHRLYPRINVTASSVVSGIRKRTTEDGKSEVIYDVTDDVRGVFSQQGHNVAEIGKSDISVNRLGGLVFQVFRCKLDEKSTACNGEDEWKVAAQVLTEGTDRAWQYFNPPWLSAMITTWCSSKPQSE